MTSFGKRKDSRGQSSGDDNNQERSGKKQYKASRSFTKNKAGRAAGPKPKFGRNTDKKGFGKPGEDKPYKPKRSFDREKGDSTERPRREFSKGRSYDEKPKRFSERENNSERKDGYSRDKFSRNKGSEDKPKHYSDERPFTERKEKSFRSREGADRNERPKRNSDEKPFNERKEKSFRGRGDSERAERPKRFSERGPRKEKNFDSFDRRERRDFDTERPKRRFNSDEERPSKSKGVQKTSDDGLIRLNKYLSNAGIASRREADILIQSGAVKVNGEVIDQLGYKIKPGDKVTYGEESVKSERKVYLLLNKPKDYITTVDDPRERRTVMDLIAGACRERVYPVGRLDRNTTGVLLLTNDGELTTKLTHPKFGVKKIYHVSLNKGLRADDFKKIIEGVELEDGPVKVDDLAFVGEGKKEIGLEIHSGRNRIVRRLFEHLGYDVIKLDRVSFAGLTKKDLPRGKHRFLNQKEISFLKMIG